MHAMAFWSWVVWAGLDWTDWIGWIGLGWVGLDD
jgi:hypothetical protein